MRPIGKTGPSFSRRKTDKTIRLRAEGSEAEVSLLDDTVDSTADTLWITRRFELEAYAGESVDLCLEIEEDGSAAGGDDGTPALWQNPTITTERMPSPGAADPGGPLTKREKRIRKQQLRALGYVD